ncbi:hypothetical protein Tco_0381991 [Tanacetum coccineum]
MTSFRLSQAQILWGMYNKKNVDYAYLLWEDFIYQIENKNTKKGNAMYYPCFTKLVVNFVMDKDPLIPRRNKKTTELETISEADLTEAEQLKIITKRSRQETHSSHASGSGADEGTGVTPGVPDAPDYDSEDDISWKNQVTMSDDEQAQDDEDADKNDVNETTQDDEDDDEHDDDEKAQDDDDEEQTESDDDGDDFIHPKLTTHDDDIIHEEETDEDDSFDHNNSPTTTPLSIYHQQMTKIVTMKLKERMLKERSWMKRLHMKRIKEMRQSKIPIPILMEEMILKALEDNFSELRQTNQKAERSPSIPRASSDNQRQLYKALVEAYEADKILLDTYGDTVTIKKTRRRCNDDQNLPLEQDRGTKKKKIARMKSLLKEKETESAEVLRLRDQVSALATDKSILSSEVSALKSAVLQKDTDISLLDSRASYLKSALDDSQTACGEARNLISSLSSERDGLASDKKKAKNKQSRARNGKDKVKPKPKSVKVRKSTPTKSKVNQVKKIQLEGLKLPNLKLYY